MPPDPLELTGQRPTVHASLDDALATPPRLRLLVIANGPRETAWAHALIVRLSKAPSIETRAIVDDVVPRMSQTIIAMENISFAVGQPRGKYDIEFLRSQAFQLVEWAHMLVCVPLDADSIAKMLAGISDTLVSEVLRGWDMQKSIILAPGMSQPMWSNPTTKKHLQQLEKEWKCVQVIEPILWRYDGAPNPKRIPTWDSFVQVIRIVQDRANLLRLGHDIGAGAPNIGLRAGTGCRSLPPEVWTLILEYSRDWELAQALGVFTSLPTPGCWRLLDRYRTPLRVYEHELEWEALTGTPSTVCKKLSQAPPEYKSLEVLFIKMILRFSQVEVLEYLETNRPDLFRTFEGTMLPTTISSFFPRIPLLRYWKDSPWFSKEHKYGPEAVDGASTHGHVEVLDWWWRQSGLPLRYTETSLEQASARGHIAVLEWWQNAALQDESIVLRPGRALLWAAQIGRPEVLQWWYASRITVGYKNDVAHTACRYGHAGVLEVWRRAIGNTDMNVDDGDLMRATLHSHVSVLEWLAGYSRGSLPGMFGQGRPIAFRVCDIQASLHRNSKEQSIVREWWAKNDIRPTISASARSKDFRYL